MKFYISALVLIFAQACSHTETKKPLNYLNGENYSAGSVQASGVAPNLFTPPVGRERITELDGIVVLINGPTQIPLKLQNVSISKNNKILATVTTGLDGKFLIKGIFKNGKYQIISDSPKYYGTQALQISDYTHKELVIAVKPK